MPLIRGYENSQDSDPKAHHIYIYIYICIYIYIYIYTIKDI